MNDSFHNAAEEEPITASANCASSCFHVAKASEWVHIPTPGDHYSPATGSAIMTIVYEMARHHATAGGHTRIIIGEGTYGDHYPAGEAVAVRFKHLAPPSRAKKAIEAGLGRIGVRRVFSEAYYRPALNAIEPGFEGPVFIHNSPAAIPLFVRERPRAKVCLWANNELFRTYTASEARRVAAGAYRLICCSDFIAGGMRRLLGNQEKIRVVHNGVDVEQFVPASAGPPASEPMVLFIGRVMDIKGPDLLVGAAKLLAARGFRFRLRIVGSGGFSASDPMTPYERSLRELASPLGGQVEFAPFTARDQIVHEYQAASIFCAPSNWDEPFGLTILEAMACGLPVVTSFRGGIPEFGGDAVLYFAPPDIERLASHLERLISDPAELYKWGCKARQRAIQMDWSRQYEVLKEILVE